MKINDIIRWVLTVALLIWIYFGNKGVLVGTFALIFLRFEIEDYLRRLK